MAEQTQRLAPRTAASTGSVAASPLREGAAASAPTAPHATPRAVTPPPRARPRETGPERFWSRTGVRVAMGVSVVASVLLHYVFGPWTLLPKHDLEFRDLAGDVAIPVDLLEGEPESPAPAQAEPQAPAPKPGLDPNAPGGVDGGTLARRDAAAYADAKAAEAGVSDAAIALEKHDASGSGTSEDAAVALAADAGVGQGGPRDAVGMIGAVGNVQAGPQLVVLVVNMAVIRAHPVGAQMGPILTAIPQWADFIAGSGVDPLRDTDWVLINGPSLVNSGRDAILVHYSAPDAVVDKAVTFVAHKYDHGGTFDAGVPGMKAALGFADRYERVFLRPQPHLLACVPKDYAPTAAKILAHAALRAPRAGEAMRLKLFHPHGPMPFFPESIRELRVWIVPRADGGADVYGEGDTPEAPDAVDAVAKLRQFVRDQNSLGVQVVTHGLLDGIEVSPDGAMVRLHLTATRDQIQMILMLAAGRLGVNLPPPPLPPPTP